MLQKSPWSLPLSLPVPLTPSSSTISVTLSLLFSSTTASAKLSGTTGPGSGFNDYTTQNKQMRHDELFRLYLVFQEMRIAGVQVREKRTLLSLPLLLSSSPDVICRMSCLSRIMLSYNWRYTFIDPIILVVFLTIISSTYAT